MSRITEAFDGRAPSMKFGSLLLAVVGSAMGLNLSVLSIGPLVPLVGGTDAAAEAATTVAPPVDTIPAVLAAVAPEDGEVLPMDTAPLISDAGAAAPAPVALPSAATATPPTGTPPTATPVEHTVPRPTAAPSTAPPATASPSTTQPPTTPSTIVTQQLRYTIDGIGVVVVLYHQGQTLEYDSAELLPGWEVDVETNTATRIELKFKKVTGGEDEAKWTLTRRNGQLNDRVER